MARYWWVARQGRKAVATAEAMTEAAVLEGQDSGLPDGFVDPLPELTRVT